MHSRARLADKAGAEAYGIRLLVQHVERHYRDGEEVSFLRAAVRDGWRLIHLKRATLLRAALSYANAWHNGFHRTTDDQATVFEPLTIDPDELAAWISMLKNWSRIEEEVLIGVDSLNLAYERDLSHPIARLHTMDRVLEWIGVSPATLATDFVRQIPDLPLRELISNYGQIADVAKQCGVWDPEDGQST